MPWREPAQRVVAGKVNPNNPSSLPTIRLAREHRTVLSVGVFPFVQNPLALPLLMLSFQRRTYNLYANTSKIMPLSDIFSPDRAIHLGPKVLFTQSLGDYRYASLLKLCDISNLLFVVSINGYVLLRFFIMHWRNKVLLRMTRTIYRNLTMKYRLYLHNEIKKKNDGTIKEHVSFFTQFAHNKLYCVVLCLLIRLRAMNNKK